MQGDQRLALSRLFEGDAEGLTLFDAVAALVASLGPSGLRVTKSQVSFRRRRGFAFVWRPGRYVKSAVPAVLSIALPRRLASDRFKEIAHPSPSVWMHHLELHDVSDIDDEVRRWLLEAYANAA